MRADFPQVLGPFCSCHCSPQRNKQIHAFLSCSKDSSLKGLETAEALSPVSAVFLMVAGECRQEPVLGTFQSFWITVVPSPSKLHLQEHYPSMKCSMTFQKHYPSLVKYRLKPSGLRREKKRKKKVGLNVSTFSNVVPYTFVVRVSLFQITKNIEGSFLIIAFFSNTLESLLWWKTMFSQLKHMFCSLTA